MKYQHIIKLKFENAISNSLDGVISFISEI